MNLTCLFPPLYIITITLVLMTIDVISDWGNNSFSSLAWFLSLLPMAGYLIVTSFLIYILNNKTYTYSLNLSALSTTYLPVATILGFLAARLSFFSKLILIVFFTIIECIFISNCLKTGDDKFKGLRKLFKMSIYAILIFSVFGTYAIIY